MAEIVRMPKLSDTMTEGVVAEWHKKVGESVKTGDLLAEIETDKATMEFESFQEGTLLHIGIEKGKAAPVDSILAILGEKGENISGILEEEAKKAPKAQPEEQKTKDAPKEEPAVAVRASLPATPARPSPAEASPAAQQQGAAEQHTAKPSNGRIKISPLARKLAAEKGIDVTSVRGTGDNGRIIRRDIEGYGTSALASAAVTREAYRDEDVSQMRKTIARRLAESKFTSPHFYLTMSVSMDNVVEARKTINEENPVKISFNDFVIRAAAAALRKHPKVNASWLGDRIRYYDHIHIGVAVAVDEGLLVPVVRFADSKSLSGIATEVKAFADKARNKKLQPEDWEGNTFTISNLGMYGIEEFTAIINPPDACIMAVGGIRQVPVVKNDHIVPGSVMNVTLSCDHRVVDGATGSQFLQTFRKLLENPVLLLGAQAI